jgi:alpha-1,6-mannosyltransferase
MIVEAVMAAGIDHPVGLILVGDGRDRARIVRTIDGNPHIHLLSPIASRLELARLMASCDALVHGCEAETFSMVAAEAVASGLPVIAPDRGGASDHALSGGLRYAAADAAGAARAIRQFLMEGCARPGEATRTMARHFEELFALYEASTRVSRCVA